MDGVVNHRRVTAHGRLHCRVRVGPGGSVPDPRVVEVRTVVAAEQHHLIARAVEDHGVIGAPRGGSRGRHLRPCGIAPDPGVGGVSAGTATEENCVLILRVHYHGGALPGRRMGGHGGLRPVASVPKPGIAQ